MAAFVLGRGPGAPGCYHICWDAGGGPSGAGPGPGAGAGRGPGAGLGREQGAGPAAVTFANPQQLRVLCASNPGAVMF